MSWAEGSGRLLYLGTENYWQCAAWDMEMEVVWYPRTVDKQRQPAALSKREDGSQRLLKPRIYQELL